MPVNAGSGVGKERQLELCSEALLRPSPLPSALTCSVRQHGSSESADRRGLLVALLLTSSVAQGLSLHHYVLFPRSSSGGNKAHLMGLDGMGSRWAGAPMGVGSALPSYLLPQLPLSSSCSPSKTRVTPCPGQALCPGIAH